MGVDTLEDRIRQTFRDHTASGGIISSPDRLVGHVLDSLDEWLASRQRLYRREAMIEESRAIAHLRDTLEFQPARR